LRNKNDTLLSVFCGFSRISELQAVADQELTASQTLQKKSYQKAYGRFFGFRELA
jgi:hypothetical protein